MWVVIEELLMGGAVKDFLKASTFRVATFSEESGMMEVLMLL